MDFDEAHFSERYDLIMLIVLGEVVAAGGGASSTSEIGATYSAIATSFQCFLLTFMAHPKARHNPWMCGLVSTIHAPHGYLGMASALAAMGPAFARIIEAIGEGNDEGGGHGGMSEEAASASESACSSVTLLHLTVATFLVSLALVMALGADKRTAGARCRLAVRASVQAAAGVIIGLMSLVSGCNASRAAVLVPTLLVPLTLFQLWACDRGEYARRISAACARASAGHKGVCATNEAA